MGSLYYIKRANTGHETYIHEDGLMLMDEIYHCCTEPDPKNRQIFRSGSTAYIKTDIHFLPYDTADFHTRMRKMIMAMNCGDLAYINLLGDFMSEQCCTLIEFEDEYHTIIKTILTFSFNHENKCIEINSFCCSTQGGGNVFNFVLNAAKCGIDKCKSKGKVYYPKIILTSLPGAVPFYEKFGFKMKIRTLHFPIFEKELDEESTTKTPEQTINIVVIQKLVNLDERSITKALHKITDRSNPFYNLRPTVMLRYSRNHTQDTTKRPASRTRSKSNSGETRKKRQRSKQMLKKY